MKIIPKENIYFEEIANQNELYKYINFGVVNNTKDMFYNISTKDRIPNTNRNLQNISNIYFNEGLYCHYGYKLYMLGNKVKKLLTKKNLQLEDLTKLEKFYNVLMKENNAILAKRKLEKEQHSLKEKKTIQDLFDRN